MKKVATNLRINTLSALAELDEGNIISFEVVACLRMELENFIAIIKIFDLSTNNCTLLSCTLYYVVMRINKN